MLMNVTGVSYSTPTSLGSWETGIKGSLFKRLRHVMVIHSIVCHIKDINRRLLYSLRLCTLIFFSSKFLGISYQGRMTFILMNLRLKTHPWKRCLVEFCSWNVGQTCAKSVGVWVPKYVLNVTKLVTVAKTIRLGIGKQDTNCLVHSQVSKLKLQISIQM